MNYNFSNNFNSVRFLPLPNQNRLTQGQMILILVSTALRQSLKIYQSSWKPDENSSTNAGSSPISSGQIPLGFETDKKIGSQKHSNFPQQNKKSIQKISYNSLIQKNDKNQYRKSQNLAQNGNKIRAQQQKLTKNNHQYIKKLKQKVIHQNNRKQQSLQQINSENKAQSLVDLYQAAYINECQMTTEQIQQKRQKLLLRKVLNWKQLDKKVGFRKMELKKLLT